MKTTFGGISRYRRMQEIKDEIEKKFGKIIDFNYDWLENAELVITAKFEK